MVSPVPEAERREIPTHDKDGKPLTEEDREYEDEMLNYIGTTVVKNLRCSACTDPYEITFDGPLGLSDFTWENNVIYCKKLQLCRSCRELIASPSKQETTPLTDPAAIGGV